MQISIVNNFLRNNYINKIFSRIDVKFNILSIFERMILITTIFYK